MKDFLTITTENGDLWYHLSYLSAVVVALVIYVSIGIKKAYNLHHWILILLSAMVFFTIGMHVLTFSGSEWRSFLFSSDDIIPQAKTSIGAFAGFLFGVWLAQKLLKTNYPVLDVFAFIFPVMILFQRAGCLIAGCCYGLPTSAPIGVQYSQNHPIYDVHLDLGLISPGELFSAPVHPVPFYFILVALLVLIVLFLAKPRLKRTGSLFLLFLAVMSIGRFIVDEFRDVHSMNVVEMNIGKLSLIQLSILLLFFLSLILLYYREKNNTIPVKTSVPFSSSGVLLLILTTVITTRLFLPLFQIIELIVLGLVFMIYLVSVGWLLLKRENQSFRVFASIGLVLSSFVFMGQMKPLDFQYEHNPNKRNLKSELLYSINSYNFGVAIGDLKGERRRYQGSGCDRTLIGYDEYQTYTGLSFHYENRKVYQNKDNILGAGIYLSPYTLTTRSINRNKTGEELRYNYLGNFYFGRDWNSFGYRLGLLFGDNNYFFEDGDSFRPDKVTVLPIIRLRFGSLNKTFISAGLGDDLLFGTYRYLGRLSIGTSFNINHRDITLELGFSDRRQVSFDSYIDLSEKLALKPTITFGKNPIYGLGVSYRHFSENAY